MATRRARVDADGLIAYWPCNESSGSPVNWALHPATRADGVVVTGYAYYTDYADDADFFPMPSGYFVVTPEWAAANGYVMAADCKANTLAQPATNIQYALDKATTSGAIVNLLPGTYYPTMTLSNKCASLTLRSYNPDTGDYDREGTVIDGSRLTSGSMLDNNGKATPEIRALTFCNTTAARGVYLKSAGKFKVLDCTFTNLIATSTGGGIHAYTCNGGLVSNCLFNACSAVGGGGIYTIQNTIAANDFCTVRDCLFTNCKANQGSDDNSKCGGGMEASRNIHVYDCVFENNSSKRKGGHLYCGGYSIVANSSFGGSASSDYGSCLFGDGAVTVSNCQFVGATSGGGFGYLHPGANSLITDCVVTNNRYTSEFCFTEGAKDVVVRQCLFADNTGAVLARGHNGQTRIENCTSLMTGVASSGSASFATNTFVNCILCGTLSNGSVNFNIISNCCIGGTAPGGVYDSHVVTGNPNFVDAANGDYSIKRSSPARDNALLLPWMTAYATDLTGNPRVVTDGKTLAENPNAKPDMGCYECLLEPRGSFLIFR